jgi:outer membrane protein OmpA-like peptidoglycan-associated protein
LGIFVSMHIRLFTCISLVLHITASTQLSAQGKQHCPPCSGKTHERFLEKAKSARNDRKPYDQVRGIVLKALEDDSTCWEVLKWWGDYAWQQHKDNDAGQAYTRLLEQCPDIGADPYYRLGEYHFGIKDYDLAIAKYTSYLDFAKINEEQAATASKKIVQAKLMKVPVPFNPTPLDSVSGADPEYLAIISPDQDFCFFTRRYEEQKRGSLFPSTVEKFMVSQRYGQRYGRGEPMPPPFNKSGSNNEGGASITIDNKHLFFTVNKNGNFDIYTSDESGNVWSEPRSVGNGLNHPLRWESQPSVAPDGKSLYFVSIRDSVIGTSDIYVSKRQADGTWGTASPLGHNINTEGNEKTPFIHPDNHTFYFSSDRLPGMGGYDIYVTKLTSEGGFSAPVNLGYPINTEADELGFFVSTDGKKGYFASNNLKGHGGYDIYSFELHEAARPEKVIFIKGEVKADDETDLEGSKIQLKSAGTQQLADVSYDSLSGRFASVVRADEDYILTVKKKGFAYSSAYFSKGDTLNAEPRKVELNLKTNKIGEAYELDNILFETESAALTQQDRYIITDFSEYLKENPGIRIALHGHTDSSGSPERNKRLSEERAEAVYVFLGQLGIPLSRMQYKGYGSEKPIADNATQEGRSKNRRTEFLILAQ